MFAAVLKPFTPVCCCYRGVQLFVTPWTVGHQAPLSMGFSRQEYWSGLPCPPPGDLPYPGPDWHLLCVLHWQVGSLPLSLLGSPKSIALSLSFLFYLFTF